MSHLQYLNFRVECQLIKQLYVKRNRAQRPLSMPLYKLKVWIEDSKFALRTDAAIVIQRNWRGYKARVFFAHYFWTKYYEKCISHYERMATKIQKVWKGYYSRRYILNFYKRKEQLKYVIQQNSYYLEHISEFVKKKEIIENQLINSYRENRQKAQGYKRHHLISTAVIPGVYNSPFGQDLEAEKFLKSLHFTEKKLLKKKTDSTCEEYKKVVVEKAFGLKKPQGPFLSPKQVMLKRYKPLNPKLQTATDYEHLKDAQLLLRTESNQQLDIPFYLTGKIKSLRYERLLCSDSQYEPPSYGRLQFRDVTSKKSISKQDFKTILPSIPLFDEYKQQFEC